MKDHQGTEAFAGRQIRQMREARGLSQAALADVMRALGFSWRQTTVAKTEAGDRPLRVNELSGLSAALNAPLDWILGDDGLPRSDASTKVLRALIRTRGELESAEERYAAARSELREASSDLEDLRDHERRLVRDLAALGVHQGKDGVWIQSGDD